MEVASEVTLIGLIVKLLYHCLYIVNQECFTLKAARIDCESVVLLLAHSESRLQWS